MNRTATRLGVAGTACNLVGLGLATYLTVEHYSTSPSFACPTNAAFDCVGVTTSSYAEFQGVPVALAGLIYFVVSTPLHLPAAWRSLSPWWGRARVAWAAIGMVSVFYLIYAELELGAICLYCTGVHIVTFLLLVLTVLGSAALAGDAAAASDVAAGDSVHGLDDDNHGSVAVDVSP